MTGGYKEFDSTNSHGIPITGSNINVIMELGMITNMNFMFYNIIFIGIKNIIEYSTVHVCAYMLFNYISVCILLIPGSIYYTYYSSVEIHEYPLSISIYLIAFS